MISWFVSSQFEIQNYIIGLYCKGTIRRGILLMHCHLKIATHTSRNRREHLAGDYISCVRLSFWWQL